jgi:hypothetical protein
MSSAQSGSRARVSHFAGVWAPGITGFASEPGITGFASEPGHHRLCRWRK